MRVRSELTSLLESKKADIRELPVSFVAAVRLSELLVAARHIEDVVHDLEQNAELLRESAVRNCLRFAQASQRQHHAHAGCDQAARLQRMQAAEPVGVPVALGDIDVLAADHAVD